MNRTLITKKFKQKFAEGAEDECWKWRGVVKDNESGVLKFNGKMHRAHRLAYELAMGPIPLGQYVMRSCENRLCVNPKHLYLATRKELDAIIKKRYRRINNGDS